jgi:Rho family protein
MKQGQRVADSIGARAYFETSALNNQGVDAVFESATRAAVLVRDQGHGGVGAIYDKDGNGRRESHRSEKNKKGSGVGKCCVIA